MVQAKTSVTGYWVPQTKMGPWHPWTGNQSTSNSILSTADHTQDSTETHIKKLLESFFGRQAASHDTSFAKNPVSFTSFWATSPALPAQGSNPGLGFGFHLAVSV